MWPSHGHKHRNLLFDDNRRSIAIHRAKHRARSVVVNNRLAVPQIRVKSSHDDRWDIVWPLNQTAPALHAQGSCLVTRIFTDAARSTESSLLNPFHQRFGRHFDLDHNEGGNSARRDDAIKWASLRQISWEAIKNKSARHVWLRQPTLYHFHDCAVVDQPAVVNCSLDVTSKIGFVA
jgi:hypothetical protein